MRGARGPAPDPAPEEAATWTEGDSARMDHAAQAGGDLSVPAGVDLDAYVGERPTTQRRGRLRRRLRHLRRVREVLLRDLGGVMFEIHRTAHDDPALQQRLVGAKLERLANVDAELHELEEILRDHRGMVLREPGIGGTCPLCGELYGSDARFCWACGTPVAPGAARPVIATGATALPAATQLWTQQHAPEPASTGHEAPTTPLAEPIIEGEAIEHAEPPPPPPPAPAEPPPPPPGAVAGDQPPPPAVEGAATPPPPPAGAEWLADPPTPPEVQPGDPLGQEPNQ
jgi:hypothetical protein